MIVRLCLFVVVWKIRVYGFRLHLELCRLKFALKASLFEVEKNEIAKKAT